MPCLRHDIKIVQRSNRQSAVAAYQIGERLFSEYARSRNTILLARRIVLAYRGKFPRNSTLT